MTDQPIHPDPARRATEDPFNILYEAEFKNGEAVSVATHPIAHEEVHGDVGQAEDQPPAAPREPLSTIHPRLQHWLVSRSGDRREEIIVTFPENLSIPRFPEPLDSEPRNSTGNLELIRRAGELADSMQAQRASDQDALAIDWEAFEAIVIERFWLINGVLVEMPLRSVRRLASLAFVLTLEPRFSGEDPPQAQTADGRACIASDLYFSLGPADGRVALLDTGVRHTHTLLTSPSRIHLRRDCVNGGEDCNTGSSVDPDDDHWNHGTSSAAIISANSSRGNSLRGVTEIQLDSFKVYNDGGLDEVAVIRAFQTVIRLLDRVILAQIQGEGDHFSAIAQAADAAFRAGAVVISANGNSGPNANSVRCPANAHLVIGVGAFDITTRNVITIQSRGPAADRRFKPDIQGPTNTQTASNATDAATRIFQGTSGAAPYVAGAAALVRNWLKAASATIDPGQVYVHLILHGRNLSQPDNTSGAGPLSLRIDGKAWWGKVEMAHHSTRDIPISVGGESTVTMLDAAIWWPEWAVMPPTSTIDPHNRITLSLVDPAGNTQASSSSADSVFEGCSAAVAIIPGTWTLRLEGSDVSHGPQSVYWAAYGRP